MLALVPHGTWWACHAVISEASSARLFRILPALLICAVTLRQEHAGTLDGIIDTVSAKHPLPDYLNLLKLNGRMVVVGVPPEPLELPSGALIFQRRLIGGSLIGGIKETQEMLVRAYTCGFNSNDPNPGPTCYYNTASRLNKKRDRGASALPHRRNLFPAVQLKHARPVGSMLLEAPSTSCTCTAPDETATMGVVLTSGLTPTLSLAGSGCGPEAFADTHSPHSQT